MLNSGKYLDSARLAITFDTAQGYALAAKAITLYAPNAIESQQAGVYEQARKYAEKAIQKDPNYAEGYFERARSLGRYSQKIGVVKALVEGLAPIIKKDLDKSLELKPNYAAAMVALALWNAEITAKGAGWAYGADSNKVIPLCEKAVKLEPNVILHRVECARGFILVDKKYKEKAIDQLEIAVKLKADTIPTKDDLEKAKTDLAELQKN